MSGPWLSVVMPTHNGSSHLRFALDSILAQRDDEIEVIAVDGASTDGTVEIFESYQGLLPLTLVRRDDPGNWVEKTNYGLSLARGHYVCFLHHDDIWLPRRLSILRNLSLKWPAATLLLHDSRFIGPNGQDLGPWGCPLPTDEGLLESAFVVPRLLVQNFIAIPAPMFKREAALDCGPMDEGLLYTADWDMWLKLAAAGPSAYVAESLAGFRITMQSQTVALASRAGELRRQLEVVLDRHMARWETSHVLSREARRAARFSIEVNDGLAAYVHGNPASLVNLARRFALLGPRSGHMFLRDSRIVERSMARVRMGMAGRARRHFAG